MLHLKMVFNQKFLLLAFEASLIEAVQLQFPIYVKHLECHFHFEQALWQKIQDVGLVVRYWEVNSIQSFVQPCNAIAFIPPVKVGVKFIEAVSKLEWQNQTALADLFS